MFDDTETELESEIATLQIKLDMIRKAEEFLGSSHMSSIHVQEYLLELVICAREFRNTTGSDLVVVVSDGLEHWRKAEGPYTPTINPAEHMQGETDD